MPPNAESGAPGTPGTPAGSLNPEPGSRPPRRHLGTRAVRGDGLAVALGGRPRGANPLRVGECGPERRVTQRRNAAEGSERAVRVALSSSRRVVEAARARRSPLGRRRHRGKRGLGGASALRARSGRASRTCRGTFAQPWLITLDSQTTRDGERAFRLGRARLEVPVMKRDEIGSPPFFIAEAERHAADRQFVCSRSRECARSGFSESARSD